MTEKGITVQSDKIIQGFIITKKGEGTLFDSNSDYSENRAHKMKWDKDAFLEHH